MEKSTADEVNRNSDSSRDRCVGVLVGLAAGDRNGGPVRLAVRLLDCILEQKVFNQKHVVEKYLNYFRGPPHDSEKAFDTGFTFYSVFRLISEEKSFSEAGTTVQTKYGSIGVGAAHRNAVLSMVSFINDKDLADAAREETLLTHSNQISVEVSLFVNILCRSLIKRTNFEDSIQIALNSIKEKEVQDAISGSAICQKNDLSRDGYAPHVLQAALYFLHKESSFTSALNESLAFAGPENLCPVLVGSIGGARYGRSQISQPLLEHASQDFMNRVLTLADSFAKEW